MGILKDILERAYHFIVIAFCIGLLALLVRLLTWATSEGHIILGVLLVFATIGTFFIVCIFLGGKK